ncbi:hypothetical protein BOO22_11040 [Vibrio cidicii]|uniref:GGDEF/EAL-containing response regulator n=1 Tax=Vibrio cidicii TaxID=1763883 RepID=UPI0018C325D3|nr:EAL domain-containing protein [Vibrio cidicii]MBG0759958.1 hypothetical protein [Vibrio cidicii]
MIDYAEILLVDDEPLILKSLERQLRRKVGHIYTAQSGASAIEILEQNQNINLVITDFRMPEMDGSELVARIKSDFPEVATIMLSGQADFERVTNAFNTGALTRYLGKPWDNDELTSVIENVLDIQSKTRNRDRLTQLKNIFALNNHIEKIKEYRCKPWLLVMLDIKSMRKFNDQYGVMEANDFIHDIAKAIPKSEKLVWYRYEDKFFTFVEYHHSGYELIFNLEKSSFASSKSETRIQVSIYLSDAYSWNTICAEEIARRKLDISPIDNHTYWLNDQSPNERVREFSELSLIIKDLRSNNFVAYFQPQLNLKTGKIDCCEALARQKGEHGKILNPAQFLPLMEKYDLLDKLTERMLNQSLQLISRLKQQQLSIRVSVNVTAAQVESGYVKQCLHNENGEWLAGTELLELEILETEKIISFSKMSEQLKLLKTAGVHSAIDDFGTGYSGFESLKEIPFDVVKIDGRFIRCLGESESDDVILKSITDSATSLNMSIVAEWVENKFQYNYLREHGCTRIQGYWVSPPLPGDDFLKFLVSY